jgi:hypothetical protein
MVRFSLGSLFGQHEAARRLIPVDTVPGEANRSDLSGPTVPRSHRVFTIFAVRSRRFVGTVNEERAGEPGNANRKGGHNTDHQP